MVEMANHIEQLRKRTQLRYRSKSETRMPVTLPIYPGLLADLCADFVFLLIQDLLCLFGDVATILGHHVTFFLVNLAIFSVQPDCFGLGYIAFFNFVFDTIVLIYRAFIDLLTTWIIFLKRRVLILRRWNGILGVATQGKDGQQRRNNQSFLHARFPLFDCVRMCQHT